MKKVIVAKKPKSVVKAKNLANTWKPPLFMTAQLPFNTEDAVKLNIPMIKLMNHEKNWTLVRQNFEELGIYKDLLKAETNFLEIGSGRGYVLESLYKLGQGFYFGVEPIRSEAKQAASSLLPFFSDSRRSLESRIPVKNKKKYLKQAWLELGTKKKNKKLLKTPILNISLEKLDISLESLDFIFSYHVFEHLENPLVMLDLAKRWLKKTGKIIIVCPNVESAMAQQNMDTWRCSLPSHRWLPGFSTLKRALEHSGFTVLKRFTYGGHALPRTRLETMKNKTYKLLNKGDVMCFLAKKL